MIILEYDMVKECIEKLDESAHLIATLDDSNLGQAIEEIIEVKTVLLRSLGDFESNLEDMSDYYEE